MRHIMMFDADDERRMKRGELIQMPGAVPTYVTFEPKRTYRKSNIDTLPRVTTAKPRLLTHDTSSGWPCRHCGKACLTAPGRGSHEKACRKQSKEVRHA